MTTDMATIAQATDAPASATGLAPVPADEKGKVKADAIRHTHRARLIYVPEGFKLASGTVVTTGFSVTLQFGVRWHPEAAAPHVMFQAWRGLPMGDALVFAGESALQFLPLASEREACAPLAKDHAASWDDAQQATKDAVAFLGLDVPKQPEPLAAFILPCQGFGGAA